MGLLKALRAGVASANSVTRDLQALVTYKRAVADSSGYGAFTYPTSVQLHAIVDYTARQVRTRDGVLTVTRATIDLLDIDEVIAATSGEGIGNDDIFILPDGDTGPILDIAGFIDRETTHPIATTVMLG